MRDLSLRPIGEIIEGDEIIGFSTGDTSKRPHVRRKLTVAKVMAISRSKRRVVKITLASGHVIRCTPDHNWYTGRVDSGHKLYKSARLGTRLMRISEPTIEKPEDERLAGWLAGFFDGEGSAVRNNRRGGAESCLITFAQGAGRNAPLCEKLEAALAHFGFEFGVVKGVRQDRRHKENAPEARWYWIKAGNGSRRPSLPVLQRFLHVIKPTKWRDRIAAGALTSRFISQKDRVISIEDDGVETVFGLTTTTGNYVVWGLASSNSGQYMQAPTPRKGGIFKREYWQPYVVPTTGARKGMWPDFDFIVVSVDSAFTEKEENDPTGCTTWGVWTDPTDGYPKIMLIMARRKHLQQHGARLCCINTTFECGAI
jgi:hypothetical protein